MVPESECRMPTLIDRAAIGEVHEAGIAAQAAVLLQGFARDRGQKRMTRGRGHQQGIVAGEQRTHLAQQFLAPLPGLEDLAGGKFAAPGNDGADHRVHRLRTGLDEAA
jgi:hypothetical protein